MGIGMEEMVEGMERSSAFSSGLGVRFGELRS